MFQAVAPRQALLRATKRALAQRRRSTTANTSKCFASSSSSLAARSQITGKETKKHNYGSGSSSSSSRGSSAILLVGGAAAAACCCAAGDGTSAGYDKNRHASCDFAFWRSKREGNDGENSKDSKSSKKPFRLKEVYEIEQVLGEGAYGMVYQARRKADGLPVALKAMPRHLTGKTDFEREVAALQLLSQPPSGPHDHVVRLYDLHRDDKNYYLAMELVEGGELLDHLIENGPYSEAVAARFVRQFAEALCYVHSSGYAHADLKPENLMLATSSSSSLVAPSEPSAVTAAATVEPTMALKVVDFGCARTHDQTKKDMLLPAEEFALGCSLLHQVALGNQFELQRILQDRPELVNFRDYDKRTA